MSLGSKKSFSLLAPANTTSTTTTTTSTATGYICVVRVKLVKVSQSLVNKSEEKVGNNPIQNKR